MKSNLSEFLSVFTVEIVREFDFSNDVDFFFHSEDDDWHINWNINFSTPCDLPKL